MAASSPDAVFKALNRTFEELKFFNAQERAKRASILSIALRKNTPII